MKAVIISLKIMANVKFNNLYYMRKLVTLCLAFMAGLTAMSAATPKMSRQLPPETLAAESSARGESVRMLQEAPSIFSIGTSRGLSALHSQDNLPAVLRESRAAINNMKAAADGNDLYGWLIFTSPAQGDGWTQVGADGSLTQLFTNATLLSDNYKVDAAWLTDGKVGMIVSNMDDTYIYGYYYYLFNADGSVAEEVKLNAGDLLYRCAYNYTDKKVYGFNFSAAGDFQWSSFDPATQTFEVLVSGVSTSLYTSRGMTYNSKTGKLIGLSSSASNNVVSIDPATGAQEVVGTLALPQYLFGFGYSSSRDCYVLNQVSTTACSLDFLDTKTLATLSSVPYSGIVEFSQIVQAEPEIVTYDSAAPSGATDLEALFSGASYNGKLTFTLPTTSVGGTPIMGDVTYEVLVDDKLYKRGTGAAGSVVKMNVSVDGEGTHTIAVVCSLGGKKGPSESVEVYTGNDTPEAPASVSMNGATVTWTPVTEGIHGGYIDASAVTYNVYINDTMVAEGVSACECSSKLDPDAPVDFYVASVEAVFDGKVSQRTSSDREAYGGAYDLPVTLAPDADQASLFTIVNANNDARSITYTSVLVSGERVPVYRYQYSSSLAADEWLFLPAVNFDDPEALYEFSLNAFRHYSISSYQEKFEVKLATAPNAESVVADVMPVTTVANAYSAAYTAELANYYNATFSVPAKGVYYIGVHVVSDKNRRYLYMRDFSVKQLAGLKVTSPTAVTGLTATAGAEGALTATVNFTMPTADFSGTAYAADKTLTAKVKAEGCPEVTVSGKSGEAVTATVTTVQGDNTITVTPYDGELAGVSASTEVYTGVSALAAVNDFQGVVSEDNMSVKLTWKAPTEGSDGGYVRTTGITYYLTEVDETGQYWVISENLGEDVYEKTITLPAGTPLDERLYGVVAENEAGYGNVTGDNFMLGTPWGTPMTDNLSDGIDYGPLYTFKSAGATAYFTLKTPYSINTYIRPLATADRRVALVCYPGSTTTANYKGCGFIFPRMSTTGLQKPALGLEVCAGATDMMYVYASTYGVEETLIASYSKEDYADLAANNVTTLTVELPDQFKNRPWVELKVTADASSRTQALVLYSYKVYDNLDNDFTVASLAGPSAAKIGEENVYTVTVSNLGLKDGTSPAGKWVLTNADGDIVANVAVESTGATVASGDEEKHVISYNPTADDLGLHTLTYTLTDTDDKAANNSRSIEFNVVKGLAPVVTDLHTTEVGFDNVSLAWSLSTGSKVVVDSFEDVTPFVLDDASDMIGDFKRVDGDGQTVYGSQIDNFASIPGAYGPSSFMVWNTPQVDKILGREGVYPAKTGDQFLIAFCPEDGSAADDWLISPAVTGGSDVSFALRALTYQYGAEKVELMVSSTGDTPESFEVFKTIEVMEEDVNAPSWLEYTYILPENARYFALHYVSADIFGVMIDDIEYAPAGSDVTVDGYTLYRNDVKLADLSAVVSYDDTTVEADTDYTYYLVAGLSTGNDGLKSNTVNVRTSGVSGLKTSSKAIYSEGGAIVVKGYEGEAVSIVGVDGVVRVRTVGASAAGRYNLDRGIYVVKAGKDIVKVNVK